MSSKQIDGQQRGRSDGHQTPGVRLILVALLVFSFTCIFTSMGVITNNKLLEFIYASQVTNYQPSTKNNDNPIESSHSDPLFALGEPERNNGSKFVSLGFGGSIILDLGELPSQTRLAQLEVVESSPGTTNCEKNPEKAEIYLGNDLSNWEKLGIACQGEKFDISGYGSFRYVYIQDISDPFVFPQGEDGYDLDGVILTHCQYCSEPTTTLSPSMDISIPDNIPSPTATVSFVAIALTVTGTPEPIGSPTNSELLSLTPSMTPEQSETVAPSYTLTYTPMDTMAVASEDATVSSAATVTVMESPVFSNTLPALSCSIIPVDVVLVIDRSSSMHEEPLANAKLAAKSFVNLMSQENDQIGLVSFSTSAHLNQKLTQNKNAITQAIDGLLANGKTNIARGISTAHTELTSVRHNPNAIQVMILLSDGKPTTGNTVIASQLAKEAGVHILTIGLGEQIDENLMRSLASNESDYYYAPDPSDLLAIYQEIAATVHCESPTATFTPSPTATVTLTPSRTPTQTPSPTPTATFTPSVTATRTPTNTATATFTPSPTATVTLTPSRTPTQTPSPTPTATVTPVPTLTPRPSHTPVNPTSTNHPPKANGQSIISQEDTTIDITLTGLDTEESTLTFVIVDSPIHGKLTGSNSKVTYIPNQNYNGRDSFSFVVSDGDFYSAPAVVDILVTAMGDSPTAKGNEYSAIEDTVLSIPAPGVLGNDSDVDGDLITAIEVTAPAHGTLTLNPDGSFVYEPVADYNGPDKFIYQTTDGELGSDVVSVIINVEPINDVPVCTSFSFNTGETNGEILPSCSDIDGNPLTPIVVIPPTHGTVLIEGGEFLYTPDIGYQGLDRFTFEVNDGNANSNRMTISISNGLPSKPILVGPANGTTLHQPTLPDQWVFTWQAAPDPCHSIITINSPDGQILSDSVYNSTGRYYKYAYNLAKTIPSNKLQPWSWQVTVICPFDRNISEASRFSVVRAPFDWERFGSNVGNLLAILGVLFTFIYILGLLPFLFYFEKTERILDRNTGIIVALANLEFFNWLKAVFKFMVTYQSNKINKYSESAIQREKLYVELENASKELGQAISVGDIKKKVSLAVYIESLLDQIQKVNSRLNQLNTVLLTKYDSIYKKLNKWRSE